MPRIAASLRPAASAGAWLARHPEWWALVVSLAAWISLGVGRQQDILLPLCDGATRAVAYIPLPRTVPLPSSHTGTPIDCAVMIVAMMTPLVVLAVRHVAFRSFRDRRHRAIAEFLVGYFVVWSVIGALQFAVLAPLRSLDPPERIAVAMLGCLVAIGWQLTPQKRAALWRCHRTVALASDGLRADLACLRFGAAIGGSCVASCWAVMALPLLLSHGFVSMACIEAALIHERYQQRSRPRMAGSVMLLCLALMFGLRDI